VSSGTHQCCDNFLCGFKGAPPARQARTTQEQLAESVTDWSVLPFLKAG
jgi:hypothetical protein